MRFAVVAAVMLGFAPVTAPAQSFACGTEPMSTNCPNALQAMASAAPQFGIVAGGGNPVPGVEGTRGVTLGLIPRTTATLRIGVGLVHLPDLRTPDGEEPTTPIAVKLGTATRLLEGSAAGTGALDLLLEGGLLTATGERGRTSVILGAGARLGLLRESFTTPGVALSGMYRHVGRMQYGSECPEPACTFAGRTRFGLNDLSARLTVGKRVGPVGLAAGAGWDRFSTTDGSFDYFAATYSGGAPTQVITGMREVDVQDSRWSAFVNLSRGLTIGSLVAEAGWMNGGDAVTNFAPGPGGYDPGQGTFFGSLSLRIQL
jgi:hypothetical protein